MGWWGPAGSGVAADDPHEPGNDRNDQNHESDPQQEFRGFDEDAQQDQCDSNDKENDNERHEPILHLILWRAREVDEREPRCQGPWTARARRS